MASNFALYALHCVHSEMYNDYPFPNIHHTFIDYQCHDSAVNAELKKYFEGHCSRLKFECGFEIKITGETSIVSIAA